MFKIILASLVLSQVLAEPIYLPLPKHPLKLGRYPDYSELVKKSQEPFIVGGTDAASGANPWQCSLRRSSHSCGASIISNQWLVTAGHCIDGASPSSLTIRCNTLTHASGGQDYAVARLVLHEQYDSWNLDNDIGLVQISGTFALGSTENINSIPLPAQGETFPDGAIVRVTGWGAIYEGGSLPARLQTLDVPIVNQDTCNQQYSGFNPVTAQMFCAGVPEGGKDSCQGDSGGPVVYNSKLIGAVSWGLGCARPNYPGVYTRVASFRNWIRTNSGV